MSAAGHVTALGGSAPALRRAEPAAAQGQAARAAPDRAAAAGRVRPWRDVLRARYVRRRCTGWRCSSRPRPSAAGYAVFAARRRSPRLLGAARAARRHALARRRRVRACSQSSLAFLAAGVPDELLRPSNWDALASGIERGISALPGARVPYRGLDQWTRIVIPLGGTMLAVLAALARVLAAALGDRLPVSRRSCCSLSSTRVPAVGARLRRRVPARCAAGAARLAFLRLDDCASPRPARRPRSSSAPRSPR